MTVTAFKLLSQLTELSKRGAIALLGAFVYIYVMVQIAAIMMLIDILVMVVLEPIFALVRDILPSKEKLIDSAPEIFDCGENLINMDYIRERSLRFVHVPSVPMIINPQGEPEHDDILEQEREAEASFLRRVE